ncbi:MAG: hypothetical protein IJT87_03895 [Ruminiclostridium sp.]|nr:hypothetical protein [Ruminiclostridium sp.]
MEKRKDLSLLNCIATGILAFLLTGPVHELFHLITDLIYGNKLIWFTSGAVLAEPFTDYNTLSPFDRIMVAGGSASIVNVIIAIVLIIILLKVKNTGPTLRLFLVQYTGAQISQGIGYFMVGGFFGAGDWGNVFECFEDSSETVTVMRIILSVVGAGGIVFQMFLLNYLSYDFIKAPSDKKERAGVAAKLHLTMFIVPFFIGIMTSIPSPAMQDGYLSWGTVLLFNLMWIPFFWGFMFTAVMVKPPKQSRFKYSLPEKPNIALLVTDVLLLAFDIFVLAPGIRF